MRGVQHRGHYIGRNRVDRRGEFVPPKEFRFAHQFDKQKYRGVLETAVYVLYRMVSTTRLFIIILHRRKRLIVLP